MCVQSPNIQLAVVNKSTRSFEAHQDRCVLIYFSVDGNCRVAYENSRIYFRPIKTHHVVSSLFKMAAPWVQLIIENGGKSFKKLVKFETDTDVGVIINNNLPPSTNIKSIKGCTKLNDKDEVELPADVTGEVIQNFNIHFIRVSCRPIETSPTPSVPTPRSAFDVLMTIKRTYDWVPPKRYVTN